MEPERLRKGGGGLGLPPEQPRYDSSRELPRRALAVVERRRQP
jgi:hypothetical protein